MTVKKVEGKEALPVAEAISSLPISTLPIEISTYLFSFGTGKELCPWSEVCRSWSVICSHTSIWKNIFFRIFPQTTPIKESSVDYRLAYRPRYMEQLLNNYSYNIYSIRKIFNSLDSSRCAVYGNSLFSVNAHSIQLWDMQTKALLQEHVHHIESFDPSLFLMDEDFICFARDDKVILLTTSNLKVFAEFSVEENKKIITLYREKHLLVAGHLEGIIKLWDMETKEELRLLFINKTKVYFLEEDQSLFEYDFSPTSTAGLKKYGNGYLDQCFAEQDLLKHTEEGRSFGKDSFQDFT